MMISPMSSTEQFQALNILEVLSDLFSATRTETLTRGEILKILDAIRNNPAVFDPDVVAAQRIATANFNSPSQLSYNC